tara:strand:- start:335 stop:1477 length:1143 start_codon:yes stop_codon:yes gene_type:complete
MKIDESFKWFTGVIEDRNDPEKLNRVRVRVFGSHTDNKQDLATADLPWAQVMMPTTSSSTSGLGQTLHGLVEGSWVVGFWKDGKSQQDPMIMGSFVGVANENIKQKSVAGWDQYNSTLKFSPVNPPVFQTGIESRPLIGYLDPRIDKLTGYEKTPEGLNPTHNPSRGYGLTLDLDSSPRNQGGDTAINYPRIDYKNLSDVNTLATGDGTYNKDIWPNNMIEEGGILSTLGLDVPLTLYDAKRRSAGNNEDRSSWVKPKYPFNHVYESESGHVIEIDDTPGYERINLFHRKGARIEINNEGEIHIIAAPHQDINLQGANVNIRTKGSGDLNIATDAAVSITATASAKIISKGPTSIISSGVTKLFSMLDTKIASIGKNIIG